jgi:hypothetical protein
MSNPFNNVALCALVSKISHMLGEGVTPDRFVVLEDDTPVRLDFDSRYDQERCMDIAMVLLNTIETLTGGLSPENVLAVAGIMMSGTAMRYVSPEDQEPIETPVFPVNPNAGFDHAMILATAAVGIGMCAVIANSDELPDYEDSEDEDPPDYEDSEDEDPPDYEDSEDEDDEDNKSLGENPLNFLDGADEEDIPQTRETSTGLEHGTSITGSIADPGRAGGIPPDTTNKVVSDDSSHEENLPDSDHRGDVGDAD